MRRSSDWHTLSRPCVAKPISIPTLPLQDMITPGVNEFKTLEADSQIRAVVTREVGERGEARVGGGEGVAGPS